jgi:hypothetical protein
VDNFLKHIKHSQTTILTIYNLIMKSSWRNYFFLNKPILWTTLPVRQLIVKLLLPNLHKTNILFARICQSSLVRIPNVRQNFWFSEVTPARPQDEYRSMRHCDLKPCTFCIFIGTPHCTSALSLYNCSFFGLVCWDVNK